MGRLNIQEVISYTEWVMATYRSECGKTFDVLFTRNFSSKKSGHSCEIISIQHHDQTFSISHPIFKEIQAHITQIHREQYPFAA